MINRNNYETWFIDFLEGNLNREEAQKVEAFLAQHPDLASELEAIREMGLVEPEAVIFSEKTALKKHALDDATQFEQACIAYIEKEATTKENAQLLAYTSTRPAKQKELQAFAYTVQHPDPAIVYPNKSSLYKKRRLVAWYQIAGYAAAVLIFGLLAVGYWSTRQMQFRQPVWVQHSGVFTSPTKAAGMYAADQVSAAAERTEEAPGRGMEKHAPQPVTAPLVAGTTPLAPREEIKTSHAGFSNEPLVPVTLHFKPSVLVFVPAPLPTVKAPKRQAEKQGLLAAVLGGKQKEQERSNAAQSMANAKMAPSVLNLLGGLSNERLSYTENNQGDIASLSFKSKLLSISLPLKSEK